MVFRILTEKELSLLDENERKHYESDLVTYQQRVAFVEQLELFENTEIEPYVSQMKPITVIGEIKNRSYATPEYVVSCSTPIENQELHISPFEMVGTVNPVLPVVSSHPEVHVDYLTKVDVAAPKLPLINKLVTPTKGFEKTEPEISSVSGVVKANMPITPIMEFEKVDPKIANMPDTIKLTDPGMVYTRTTIEKSSLPNVVKPTVQTDLFFEPVNIKLQDIQISSSNIDTPNTVFAVSPFAVETKHNVPEVAIRFTEVKPFEKVEPTKISLSKISSITAVRKAFKKVETVNAELPIISYPSTNEVSFKKSVPVEAKLPETLKINSQSNTFEGNITIEPDLPTITKITTTEQSFKAPKKPKTSIITIKPIMAKVNPLQKIEAERTAIPSINIVTIPDADKALKDILPMVNKGLGEVGGEVS